MVNLYLRKRKRLLKNFILTILLFVLVFFFYSLIRLLTFRLFQYDLSAHDIVALFLSIALVSVFYKPADHLVQVLFKDIIFRSYVRDHSALAQLSRSLTTVLDQTELGNLIVNTFAEALYLRTASVLLYDKTKEQFRVISAFGLKPSTWRNLALSPNCLLFELLRTRKIPLERERIVHSFSWQEANELRHDFELLHASYVIPLFFQTDLIGSINLTPQAGAKVLTPQELKSFFEFAKEAAQAFRTAALFDELRESNRELMKIQSSFLHSAQHAAIAQLATGIAQEIHNPLTIISGKAQILLLKRDKIAYDKQVEEVLKTIVKQTKRAADITRKLLMFSESHKSAKELIDFETIVNDTIALLSYQVSLDQIQVVKQFDHPIPKWYGNIGELREIFLNLFLNAVQAIGTKGAVQVTVRYQKSEDVIELRVSDSGAGIPESDLAKVFQPFFTTRTGASGLGLFVTQQILQGYGGFIRVESKPTEGATFIIELPCKSKNSSAPSAEESGPAALHNYPGGEHYSQVPLLS